MYQQKIKALSEIAEKYKYIICDVWGVLHNGLNLYDPAITALEAFQAEGGKVILLTNAPKPHKIIEDRFYAMGVKQAFWNKIITSGDAVREYIANDAADKRIYHWGGELDQGIYQDVIKNQAPLAEANLIICSGLEDSDLEITAQEAKRLTDCAEAGVPFLCANPDLTVHVGSKTWVCAGAAAQIYREAGGDTIMFGKPYPLVYQKCLKHLEKITGADIQLNEILAIGDGLHTDIKGAEQYGMDTLFIQNGVHQKAFAVQNDFTTLRELCETHDVTPCYYMKELQ